MKEQKERVGGHSQWEVNTDIFSISGKNLFNLICPNISASEWDGQDHVSTVLERRVSYLGLCWGTGGMVTLQELPAGTL
jgi:hypothetical protein